MTSARISARRSSKSMIASERRRVRSGIDPCDLDEIRRWVAKRIVC